MRLLHKGLGFLFCLLFRTIVKAKMSLRKHPDFVKPVLSNINGFMEIKDKFSHFLALKRGREKGNGQWSEIDAFGVHFLSLPRLAPGKRLYLTITPNQNSGAPLLRTFNRPLSWIYFNQGSWCPCNGHQRSKAVLVRMVAPCVRQPPVDHWNRYSQAKSISNIYIEILLFLAIKRAVTYSPDFSYLELNALLQQYGV